MKRKVKEPIDSKTFAERMASHYLALANRHLEDNQIQKAQKEFEWAQKWLDGTAQLRPGSKVKR